MAFLLTHPYYFIPLFIVVLLVSNWWWAISIYSDAKQRTSRHPLLWGLFALFTVGPAALTVYTAWTRRPQSTLSLSLLGTATGEKLEKLSTRGRILLTLLFVGWLGMAVLYVIYGGIPPDGLNYAILNFIFPLAIIAYIVLAPRRARQIHPLDKPLWGMTETPEGMIDESFTKHKRAVVLLIALIVSLPILLATYVVITSKFLH